MKFELRKTERKDLESVMKIYENARKFMAQNGNPDQWWDYWPPRSLIEEDIEKGISYVVIYNNEIAAVFAFIIGEDPTYINIEDGKWLSNESYGTIHRIASSLVYNGIFPFVVKELEKFDVNLRVDTHKNNIPMRHQIENTGFKYCGIIHVINNGERLAFEKLINF